MRSRTRILVAGLVVVAVPGRNDLDVGGDLDGAVGHPVGRARKRGVRLARPAQHVAARRGGSEADAGNGPLAEASGSGVCSDTFVASSPCPTSATSSLAGDALHSTQQAVARGNGVTATPTGASNCPVARATPLITVNVSCGSASASEDANGNPAASGDGSLANVPISLSPSTVLQGLLGGPPPSASSVCNNAPAARSTPGTNAGPLPAQVSTLLAKVNGILPSNLRLKRTSVASGSVLTGQCSVLSGLLTQIGAAGGTSPVAGIVTGLLDQILGLTGGNAVSVQPLSIHLGGSTSAVSTNGDVVTDSVTQHAVNVNLFGLAGLMVAPTTASVTLDRITGTVTPSCNAGGVSYSTNGSLPSFVSIAQLNGLLRQVLSPLGSSDSALATALGSLLTGILSYNPTGNLLTCATSVPGTTASAKVDVLHLGLLPALRGGVALNVGAVSVTGSAQLSATPPVATSPATAAPPAGAVPNVTSVHTGEYWAGPLPIVLMTGMGLVGLVLIGRRRIVAVGGTLQATIRRRGVP